MQSFLNCAQQFIRVTHACAYKAAFKMSINGCNCTQHKKGIRLLNLVLA